MLLSGKMIKMSKANKKIACLDTDVIIKMSRNNSGLLQRIIDIFDKCYLHERVYQEVKWPEETVKLLNKLINANKIVLITDKELFNKLEIKELFLDSLKQALEIFGIDYSNLYSKLENYLNEPDRLIAELEDIDRTIEDNIGEIRTLQMIILLRDIEKEKINYFISDDRRARNAVVLKYGSTLTGQKIYGISLIGAFYLLREEGLSKAEALKYIKYIQPEESKLFIYKNRRDKMSNLDIIDKL